ncbi:uncharacterized protein A4U43_C06F2410 [Asparagus officinalis]|uniref:Protein SDA1 n=1 Tax=Asparagus officinalis TaxID=4686 RepID=A0A5P1EJ48_ASPOF|nr:protein SDA1 homolog [Asparagus officinalis]ONK65926.1 uncharacterized protein A4U43_C06F2410 [Asparagus officinalis]
MPAIFSPESLSAAGKSSEKLSLPSLQSKMKSDPSGYLSELQLIIRRFESSLDLFHRSSALNPSSDPALAKELADLAMFLAHVSPFYAEELREFPNQVAELLREDGRALPSSLRCHLAQALILLINRKVVGIEETLELFMELQVVGDRTLRKLAFSHVVHTIRRMNQKHKNEVHNRRLQTILRTMLEGQDEARAKRALVILCDLHRRRVWFDEQTANAICTACLHPSSKILTSALSFILGYERVEDENDSEESSGEDDTTSQKSQIVLSREAVYKAHHKGTAASKKKKKAKLQRVMRSMKRQQRLSSEKSSSNSYSPLTHLKNAQGFAEELFSRLRKCNERFEVRMMIMKVIARTIGMHRLVLLNFYPFLQRYVQPHQRDVTELLAAAVQACHDMVPPDAVEPLFKQIVNQFVHDRSRTEAIAVGLNAIRELCLRIPLLMDEDLLQDLVLYKKSHEKAVSTAARSLITLFREICPSLLIKKDRGRPIDPKARRKAFGEVSVAGNVPGIELLQDDDSMNSSSDGEVNPSAEENGEVEESDSVGTDDENVVLEEEDEDAVSKEEDEEDSAEEDDAGEVHGSDTDSDDNDIEGYDEGINDQDGDADLDDDDADVRDDGDDGGQSDDCDDTDREKEEKSNPQKRKSVDYVGHLNAADTSLRALKKIAVARTEVGPSDTTDGILSNEDFQRIKELMAKKEAKLALAQQGLVKKGVDARSAPFKVPSSEQLSTKRVDPAVLEVNIRRKFSKEERLALVRAGREDRGKYQARAAVKQKKTGGLSNRQKEHKKAMPLAAKRRKIARSRQEKKKQDRRSGKQFRGKKAWK